MRILFLFFDGIGLGDEDPERNPFAAAQAPTLSQLAGGQRWVRGSERRDSGRALFAPTDACMGVEGKPQSATGQAAILTGLNVPRLIGRHYGPKPIPEIAEIVMRESVISRLAACGRSAGLLNAYPSQHLASLRSGKRLLSASQLALHVAGVELRDGHALLEGRALSADFTGQMWWSHAALRDSASQEWRARSGDEAPPVMTPYDAGHKLAALAEEKDFTFFDCWLTDYVGHRGSLTDAVQTVELMDGVLAGLLAAWDDSAGLVVITSDHGNLEDMAERGHTRNLVPTVIFGEARHAFASGLTDLTGFAPALLTALC